MKKLLKASLLLFIALFAFNACTEDDDSEDFIIDYSSLPSECKAFVTAHFGADIVVSQTKERYTAESDGTYYMVYLSGGYEIDFKKNGDWVSVEHATNAIPQTVVKLLPAITQEYLTTNYADAKVVEIDKLVSGGYEVDLNNNIDLLFDSTGKFLSKK
ncbi:putative PepSY-like beta-lactamase-inhibitor [Dysgonomonas alginatilytica]|uniref:Putative PepSY-like beta-lactamase-inhibitor n=1 Tax=Dysgonomonas alginatilytica TaxID=1605892 RepID=A0A2V3PWI7_9BACT|nr:PepSY-like domain-containing protein [Dysgonomonas alginatilytica]PXV68948.1 putative PepSY-like beta-lactamase-inhibitor [Dysgonomonas alginatilytica]